MQLIAHGGPTWSPNGVDTQPSTGQTAVAVGRTVVIYAADGTFEAELRATGQGRVNSVSFCRDPALTHLLVVSTSERFIRIFDVTTRRIFRSVWDASSSKSGVNAPLFATRFVPRAPFLLFVVFHSGDWRVLRIDSSLPTVACKGRLSVDAVQSVADLVSLPNMLFITTVHQSRGVVHAFRINGDGSFEVRPVYDGKVCQNLAIIHSNDQKSKLLHIALVSSQCSTPQFYTSTDGYDWQLRGEDIDQQAGTGETGNRNGKGAPTIRISCNWLDSGDLITSDARGTLIAWRVSEESQLQELCRREGAHMRQVFAVSSVGGRSCITISMDRTVAAWQLDGLDRDQPALLLRWRTLRSNGPVNMLAVSPVPQGRGKEGDYILSYNTCSGALVSLLVEEDDRRKSHCVVLGEVGVFGSVLGKRGRHKISHIAPIPQMQGGILGREDNADRVEAGQIGIYKGSDGQVGVLCISDDGVVRKVCKRAKSGKPAYSKKIPEGKTWTCNEHIISIDAQGHVKTIEIENGDTDGEGRGGAVKMNEREIAVVKDLKRDVPITAVCAMYPANNEAEYLVGDANGVVRVCGLSACRTIELSGGISKILCVAFDAASSTVALADGNGQLLTFDMKTAGDSTRCACKVTKLNKLRAVWKMKWSPSQRGVHSDEGGKYLVTISKNGDVLIWEWGDDVLRERAQIKEHVGMVNEAVWTCSDGLLTAGDDGTVRRWSISKLPRK